MKRRYLGILVLTSAAFLLAGCDSNKTETEEEMALRLQADMEALENVSAEAIFSDLSPELLGMTARTIDARKNVAVNTNINVRLFWDDLGRVLLLDRPSRLAPRPTPY